MFDLHTPLFAPVHEYNAGSRSVQRDATQDQDLDSDLQVEQQVERVSLQRLQEHFSTMNADYPVLTLNQTELAGFRMLVQYMDTNTEAHASVLKRDAGRGTESITPFYDHEFAKGKANQWATNSGILPLFSYPTAEESPTGRRFVFGLRPHHAITGLVRDDRGVSQAKQDFTNLRDPRKLRADIDAITGQEFHNVFGLSSPLTRDDISFILLPNGEFDRARKLLPDKEARRVELNIYDQSWDGRVLGRLIISEAHKMRASDIHLNPVGHDFKKKQDIYAVTCEVDGKLEELPIILDGNAFNQVIGALQRMSSSTDSRAQDSPQVGFDGQISLKPSIVNRNDPENSKLHFTHDAEKLKPVRKLEQGQPFYWPMNLRGAEFRVARVPTPKGPKLTIRIHPPKKIGALSGIGLTPQQARDLYEICQSPKGLVLMTGPTGCGKSTTLYTMLNTLNDGTRHIVTLEQPIEQELPGAAVTQIQMTDGKYEFKDAMRQVLRIAPKVLLIGEMRDSPSAEAAVAAANTGHLVFSTVHVNDSARAIKRLSGLGVEQSQIADCLQCVMAQRLLPKINKDYTYQQDGDTIADPRYYYPVDIAPMLSSLLREKFEMRQYKSDDELTPEENLAAHENPENRPIKDVPAEIIRVWPKSKEEIDQSDYSPTKGRAPIIEILVIDDEMRKMIDKQADPQEIKEAGMYREHYPFIPMELHGLAMVLLNQATLDEFKTWLGTDWTRRESDRRAAVKMVRHFINNMHRDPSSNVENPLTIDELLMSSVRKSLDED